MLWLKRRFALSDKGTFDLLIGSLACTLQNLALMLPVGLIYSFMKHLILLRAAGTTLTDNGAKFYISTAVIILCLMFMASFFQYNSTFLATYRESGIRRITVAERLRKIPLSFFAKKDLADLTASIMNDCAALETCQSHFAAPLIGSIISTSIIALSLLVIDWRMAIAALWVLPVAFGIVGLSAKVQQKFSRLSLGARISCEEGVQEFLECTKDLRSNNYANAYVDGLTGKVKEFERRSMSSELGTAIFVVSAYLVLKLGLASTALTGAILFSEGSLKMPEFLLFILAASRLYDPLEVSLQNLAAIISTRSGVDRLNEIFDAEIQTGSDKLTNRNYDIEFRNVSFSYDDGEKVLHEVTETGGDSEILNDISHTQEGVTEAGNNSEILRRGEVTEAGDNGEILHDVSFIAKQGEVTALVGPSGAGKTTAARLITRFWDVTKGNIFIGGMNVKDVDPEKLMSLISVVFQDVILFNNSVLENIRIGRKNASNEEVINAGKLANCEEFVSRLPDGWKTQIGENGCELSGGERQRISIARAILKNSPIILLDEATASLDAENETVIQSAISRLIKNKTVLVIAHRMRTIMGADKVIVLADKKIAEHGTPEELMKLDGIFANMVKTQGGN